jgi:hypothetical protein
MLHIFDCANFVRFSPNSTILTVCNFKESKRARLKQYPTGRLTADLSGIAAQCGPGITVTVPARAGVHDGPLRDIAVNSR